MCVAALHRRSVLHVGLFSFVLPAPLALVKQQRLTEQGRVVSCGCGYVFARPASDHILSFSFYLNAHQIHTV